MFQGRRAGFQTLTSDLEYAKNKEQYAERNKAKKELLRHMIRDAKSVPCNDCGIQYPHYVMDFDHKDQSTKTSNVSKLVHHGSVRKLESEIAKCEVVCANCHRIRTAKQLGYESVG